MVNKSENLEEKKFQKLKKKSKIKVKIFLKKSKQNQKINNDTKKIQNLKERTKKNHILQQQEK